jgi:hypothetical protein
MSKRDKGRKGHSEAWYVRRRLRRVPPAESELWPEWCRGTLWEPEVARWFAGRCQLCAYASQPPEGRRRLDRLAGLPTFLLCTNHPEGPGQLRQVIPTDMCRNFKVKLWLPERAKRAAKKPDSTRGKVCHIPLGHGRFATIDARDYPRIGKYKWCASNKRGTIYAMRRTKEGRTVYMHREIRRARKGTFVDHIDHNTLNNRRCNLRVCTAAQNYANMGPHGGVSGYVGAYPRGKRWEAGITWRGKHYYLGNFDDPVEAAKARDRKAYELHGEYAYLNFPDEFRR